MLWRYQTSEDLEETNANRQISEEEAKKMKDGSLIVIEGQKRILDEILTRKKLKQSYEFEISLKGVASSENIWLPCDDLIKRGFEKVCLHLFIVWSLVLIASFTIKGKSRGWYSWGTASRPPSPPCSTWDWEALCWLWSWAWVFLTQHHERSLWWSKSQDRPRCCHMASSSCHVSRRAYQWFFFSFRCDISILTQPFSF